MNKFYILLIFAFSLLLLAGCLDRTMRGQNVQLVEKDHPLVDEIWDVNQAIYVKKEQFLAQLPESRYILLGENHDNISHHVHQSNIISALAKARLAVSVHFEMIDDAQYENLKQDEHRNLNELIDSLNKSDTGWQYERMYKVVFDQVLQAGYPYRPANLSYADIRSIIKKGENNVPGDIKNLLVDVPLSMNKTHELEQEVIEGHCNALPASMVPPMMLAQRVRDARMGLSMMDSDMDHRVLIAGNGHVRKDRGVPMYLAVKHPQEKIMTVGFTEVIAGKHKIDEYKSRWGKKTIPFDYVWFTPGINRKDPCDDFISKLNK